MATDAAHELLRQRDAQRVLHPFSALHTQPGRDVLVVRSARGLTVTDDQGHEYLDAGSGLWCVNVGYGREELVQAAAQQMRATSFSHSFSIATNEPLVRLSERLIELAPPGFERVLYTNGGSDANDTQVKLAWRYHRVRGQPSKRKIISRRGGYHGTTVCAGSLTGLAIAHRGFGLPLEPFLHTSAAEYHRRPAEFYGDEQAFSKQLAAELEALILREGADTVAAFIAEPVMGSAGVIVPPAGYFREIQQVLDRHHVLLIADEVITAFGRTGAWFASPGFDVRPDLITCAKGLTSGYFPMAACLVSEKVCRVIYAEQDADGMFGHGFTTSGHPVGAAVALANIEIIANEGLLANSQLMGEHLLAKLSQALRGARHVGSIRGRGLMVGVEFDQVVAERRAFDEPTRPAALLAQCCYEERLIARGGHGRVVAAIAPPLVVDRSTLDEIVARMARAVARFEGRLPSLIG